MSEFSAVAYENTGYTGFLSSSGFDLSLVFMNINAITNINTPSYPINTPTMVGYSNKINGTASDFSVSSGTPYNVASAAFVPGVYIVTIYVNNTPTTSIGYVQYLTLELSTSTDLSGSAVKLTGSAQIQTGGNNSIIANITMPLKVNTSATYNLLMSVTYSAFTGVTCKTSTCFISYVKIA